MRPTTSTDSDHEEAELHADVVADDDDVHGDFEPSDDALLDLGFPRAHVAKGWADYEQGVVDVDGRPLRDLLMRYAAQFPQHLRRGEYGGLVILGPPGVGKSLGASLVGLQAARTERYKKVRSYDVPSRGHRWVDAADPYRVAWLSAADWVSDQFVLMEDRVLKAYTEDAKNDERRQTAARARRRDVNAADLLILDDLGREHQSASGYGGSLLEQLVRSRGDRGQVTVVTSNLRLTQFLRYSVSMPSYLHQVGEIIAIPEGDDFRKRRRNVAVVGMSTRPAPRSARRTKQPHGRATPRSGAG